MKRLSVYISDAVAALLMLASGVGCAEMTDGAPPEDGVRYLEQSNQFAEWTAGGTVLVDFYADWCGPCRSMSPVLSAFAQEMKNKITIVKVNVDRYPALARTYQVANIPYLVLFRDGKVADRRLGVQSLEQLRLWVLQTGRSL